MHRIVAILITAALTVASLNAYAHGGRTDKNGCHKDRSSGTRHCH